MAAGATAGPAARRALPFLAHKLEVDERQVAELARVLGALKTERAQAAVDDRRSLAELADAVTGEAFDPAKTAAADGVASPSAGPWARSTPCSTPTSAAGWRT